MPHNGEHKVAGYSGLSGRMHRNTQTKGDVNLVEYPISDSNQYEDLIARNKTLLSERNLSANFDIALVNRNNIQIVEDQKNLFQFQARGGEKIVIDEGVFVKMWAGDLKNTNALMQRYPKNFEGIKSENIVPAKSMERERFMEVLKSDPSMLKDFDFDMLEAVNARQ